MRSSPDLQAAGAVMPSRVAHTGGVLPAPPTAAPVGSDGAVPCRSHTAAHCFSPSTEVGTFVAGKGTKKVFSASVHL